MLHRNRLFRCRLGIALIAALSLAPALKAETTNGLTAVELPKLASFLYPGELIGRERVLRQILRSGTNEFFFIVPEGLHSQLSSDGAVVLGSPDQTYYVTVRIVGTEPSSPGLKEALLERLAGKYGKAVSPADYTATVADREGTGFELKPDMPKVGTRLVRILWVPFKAGVMEFALDADTRRAVDGENALDMVLITFRSNERGKLEILERSDKS